MGDPVAKARFLARVGELAGVRGDAELERLVGGVLSTLMQQLAPLDRRHLTTLLPVQPPKTAAELPLQVSDDLDSFVQRVAMRASVEPGPALEHAQVVCRAITETLSGEARVWLVNRLPQALGELFTPRASHPPPRPSPAARSPQGRRSLSEGRSGSSSPLSEAEPGAAHTESVARSSDPHGDAKLSGSRGLTQEREGETLAGGRPGPSRARK